MEVLDRASWQARAESHAARLAPYVQPHLARREARRPHPVHDFLFTYYAQRPTQLLRWHPGAGTALEDAGAYATLKGYATRPDGTTAVTEDHVASQRVLLETLHRLLRATATRTPNLGCFGMHEWAMVYRLPGSDVRHAAWPLRLGPESTDRVVERHRIACSHFDAYRFFTPAARPLNTLAPAAHDRAEHEQPACLHGNMDLYKHAFRLSPLIDSDLVADCFELAWDIRIMDMRAAPYDLTGVVLDPTGEPWTPVAVETAEGKQEYAAAQAAFADRAAPLRARLAAECERLLALVPA